MKIKTIFFSLLLFGIGLNLTAQPEEYSSNPHDNANPVGPDEDESNPVPISGIAILAIAGAAAGAKAIQNKKKEYDLD
tara:strand:- start:2831 stop:3064 length:234 start_codon:yes stop_codon:yes gene_type:complete